MSTPTRIKRYNGHEAFNSMVREDWIKAIEQDPDRFQAYLYLPAAPEMIEPDGEEYEPELIEELDTNQDTLTYLDPELVSLLDCPDEQEHFFGMDDEAETLSESEMPLMLRVARVPPPPVGSVLEWDEETAQGDRTVWWYVHRNIAYGTAQVGALTVCIPMRDFNAENFTPPPVPETLPELLPDPEPETEPETLPETIEELDGQLVDDNEDNEGFTRI